MIVVGMNLIVDVCHLSFLRSSLPSFQNVDQMEGKDSVDDDTNEKGNFQQ